MSIKSQVSAILIRTQSDCKSSLFECFMTNIPSFLPFGPSTPFRGLPPPGSHTRPAPLWCLAMLPALISFPHPPQVTILTCPPPPNPNPNIPPANSPPCASSLTLQPPLCILIHPVHPLLMHN